MNIVNLLKLIETSQDLFYEQLTLEKSNQQIELYWNSFNWRYRVQPYTGDWIIVDSPFKIGVIEQELFNKMKNFLLTEYCYFKSVNSNIFREKRIEKVLGYDECHKALLELNEFNKILKTTIEKLVKDYKKPNLKLVNNENLFIFIIFVSNYY